MRPKHTRRDANHARLVANCRDIGIVVWDTADLGGEILDTIMFWRGICMPIEIKAPGKRTQLTDGERESIETLKRIEVPHAVAVTVEDVIEAFEHALNQRSA